MQPIRIHIVDDDPSSRMSVGFYLDGEECQIYEFDSGEACVAAIAEIPPDIILLDVEMPGMDGIATCKAIRDSGNDRAQIIFLSSHDDLATRLTAYDAGGNDYIVKPCQPEELKQKVLVAMRTLEKQASLSINAAFAQQTAFTAMSSMGELGIAIEFLRASFSCITVDEVAGKLFTALDAYGLQGMVELRLRNASHRFSSNGECSPLETSILSHTQNSGRLFQLGTRLAVNYPRMTLVVTNLPTDDPDRVGRLRDHLAIIAEGGDAKMAAIESEMLRHAQSDAIYQAVADLSISLGMIEQRQQDHRVHALNLMNNFIGDMEKAFLHMGLNERNEIELIALANNIRDRIGHLMAQNKDLGDGIAEISTSLKDIGTR